MTKEEFKQELKPEITTQGQIKTIKKAVGGLLDAAGKTLNYMAAWVAESEYKINDLVTYDGDMYICIADVNDSSVTPAADSEHFAPFGEQKHLYAFTFNTSDTYISFLTAKNDNIETDSYKTIWTGEEGYNEPLIRQLMNSIDCGSHFFVVTSDVGVLKNNSYIGFGATSRNINIDFESEESSNNISFTANQNAAGTITHTIRVPNDELYLFVTKIF